MSIEKNMNARIQHKHDIEANWNKALNFIPKAGEIIVYDIDENYNYSRFKIGDGVRTVNNLEFLLDTQYILHNSGVTLKTLIDALQTEVDGKSDTNHTHNYAGSNSIGGSANSAVKLDTSAGSATQPIYFKDGKPVATTHSLGASVPSDAKFTDTTYDVVTTTTAGLMSAADKAKLDGLSESGGSSIQSDMNQNDSSAPDYIKHRTHWAEDPVITTETTLEETTFDGFSDGALETIANLTLVDGAECVVTWDGVEYTSICKKESSDGVTAFFIGNPAFMEVGEDNGQPFVIVNIQEYGLTAFMSNDVEATSHTVKIVSTITTQEIHKLDVKYIDAEWMAKKPVAYDTVMSVEDTTVVATQDGETFYGSFLTDCSSVLSNDIFYVTIDGVEYTSIAIEFGPGTFIVGNMGLLVQGRFNGGDPYMMTVLPEGVNIYFATEGDHVVSFRVERPIYEQLPAHYISDVLSDIERQIDNVEIQIANKQNKLTFDKTPTSGSTNPVTSGGLYSKFATQDEDITMAGMTANIAMPGSLKWDGFVGDREYVVVMEESPGAGMTMRMAFVHISDYFPEVLALMLNELPEEERILPAFCSIFGQGAFEISAQVADDMFIMSESFFYVPADGYSMEGIVVFPKKGWYFLSYSAFTGDIEIPIMYNNGLLIPMDGLSFPDSNDRYFENKTVPKEITWDGNTDGLEYISISDVSAMYKVSNDIPNYSDLLQGFTLTKVNNNGEIETITYSAEDISNDPYILVMQDNGSILIDIAMVGITPKQITNNDGTSSGTYFFKNTSGAHIISLIYNGGIAKVIKTEHLPEALQFGEITKTTYSDTLTWDGNTEGLVVVDVGDGLNFYKISDNIPKEADFVSGGSITIVSYSTGLTQTSTISDSFRNEFTDDGFAAWEAFVIVPTDNYTYGTFVFPKSGIYVYASADMYISSFTINNYTGFKTTTTEFVKIDPKYLPDNIGAGGGSNINVDTTLSVAGSAADAKAVGDALASKSNSDHTHNYAGSSSAGGAATSANKLTTARTISLNGAVSGSTTFDGSKNVSITTSNGQHISNRGSGTYYYKLGTMVADDSGNYGNITISGRLGGWEQSNSANFDIMMLNRSSARDGNTITATVSASGNTVGAFGNCDIVVYKQDDTSEIVYLKLSGYWLYDFDWSVFQHSISYSATNVTPTGTLVWSLSGAPKTILDTSGNFYIKGSKAATVADIESAIGAAIAASY